jgi:SAM-dependent methyltransferase
MPSKPTNREGQPRLYADLASWWPLLSPPAHYVEEVEDLAAELFSATDSAPRTLLELGCGGGSLAFNLKCRLDQLTLTDLSPDMLAASRAINPECEHLLGDMRSLNLGREFDRVLIHDAIMYAIDPASLRATLRTAYRHCRPGGAAVFVPDCVKETFEAKTVTGGEDAPDGRGLRSLEWTWDPDPTDTTFDVAFAFLLRDADGTVHAEGDRHRNGIFPRAAWLSWLEETGFVARSRIDRWGRDVFLGVKPLSSSTAQDSRRVTESPIAKEA